MESNELTKNLLKMIDIDKEILNELLAERAYEFNGIKDKINPNNWIYNFKTEGVKDFRGYQNLLKLILGDGDVNPKEVLKN